MLLPINRGKICPAAIERGSFLSKFAQLPLKFCRLNLRFSTPRMAYLEEGLNEKTKNIVLNIRKRSSCSIFYSNFAKEIQITNKKTKK